MVGWPRFRPHFLLDASLLSHRHYSTPPRYQTTCVTDSDIPKLATNTGASAEKTLSRLALAADYCCIPPVRFCRRKTLIIVEQFCKKHPRCESGGEFRRGMGSRMPNRPGNCFPKEGGNGRLFLCSTKRETGPRFYGKNRVESELGIGNAQLNEDYYLGCLNSRSYFFWLRISRGEK